MTDMRYRGRTISDTTSNNDVSDIYKKIEHIIERDNRYHYESGLDTGRFKGFIGGFIAGCVMIGFIYANTSICK